MSKLATTPYRGTRDWYPDDYRIREYVYSAWRRICESYGYEGYDAPLLEPLDIFAAKSGHDLVNDETYQFVDRGDRHVVIRPEMTPSVSRMVAARRQEIPYPARWYSIGKFMRYERPQRGREREFVQLNVDVFGDDSLHADAEIITMGAAFLQEFGATSDMYTIRINNRKLINYIMAHYLQLDASKAQAMMRLIDKKDKISSDNFQSQARDIFGKQDAQDGMQKIASLLTARSFAELPDDIRDSSAAKEVQQLFTLLERAGITNAVFDITLMRGFDYYTGTVFEFFDVHPENKRALYGGGRYNGLVGLFGAEPISAVGMAPGLSMTMLFLEVHGLLPTDLRPSNKVYTIVVGEAHRAADTVARELRAKGLNIEVDYSSRKLDKQLKAALKKQATFALFIGENEAKTQSYSLKNLDTKQEYTGIPVDKIAQIVQA